MTKYVVRVDDVGQSFADPWKLDVEMADFRKWWKAWTDGGPAEVPIYLGVVPANLTSVERRYLLALEEATGARIALHGFDHHPHTLTPDDVRRGLAVFPHALYHIAPFNRYSTETIQEIGRRTPWPGPRPVLFGGLRENAEKKRPSDHPYGPHPKLVHGVVHLSSEWPLYIDNAMNLLDGRLDSWPDNGYPAQIVLHYSWDMWTPEHLEGVTALRRALEGRIASVDEAVAYAERATT